MIKHSFKITKPVKELSNLLIENKTITDSNVLSGIAENLELLNASTVEEDKTKVVKETDLIDLFTKALIAKDLTALSSLLADDGAFIALNKTYETVPVIKEQYVNWLRYKLQTESVTSVETDSCMGCDLGKNVVLYNNGSFPWAINNIGSATKAGLNFTIENGKIESIRFCYRFKITKNQYGFEKRNDIYQQYLTLGYDVKEANRLSGIEWNNKQNTSNNDKQFIVY